MRRCLTLASRLARKEQRGHKGLKELRGQRGQRGREALRGLRGQQGQQGLRIIPPLPRLGHYPAAVQLLGVQAQVWCLGVRELSPSRLTNLLDRLAILILAQRLTPCRHGQRCITFQHLALLTLTTLVFLC